MSAMAEVEQRVRDCFITKDINSAGIYLMRFFLNGEEYPVVVDDWVPLNQHGGPLFSWTKQSEIWVFLLEKAWAKL